MLEGFVSKKNQQQKKCHVHRINPSAEEGSCHVLKYFKICPSLFYGIKSSAFLLHETKNQGWVPSSACLPAKHT